MHRSTRPGADRRCPRAIRRTKTRGRRTPLPSRRRTPAWPGPKRPPRPARLEWRSGRRRVPPPRTPAPGPPTTADRLPRNVRRSPPPPRQTPVGTARSVRTAGPKDRARATGSCRSGRPTTPPGGRSAPPARWPGDRPPPRPRRPEPEPARDRPDGHGVGPPGGSAPRAGVASRSTPRRGPRTAGWAAVPRSTRWWRSTCRPAHRRCRSPVPRRRSAGDW